MGQDRYMLMDRWNVYMMDQWRPVYIEKERKWMEWIYDDEWMERASVGSAKFRECVCAYIYIERERKRKRGRERERERE